jgi:hypothetical protein
MRGRHRSERLWYAATPVAATLVAAALIAGGCSMGQVQSVTSRPGIVVTFEVNEGERFRVLLTDPIDQAQAARLLDGLDGPDIPDGRIVHDTGVNEGWSWSLDPADFEFADLTTKVCDGQPSDIESGALTSDRYCPWSARVVEIEPPS